MTVQIEVLTKERANCPPIWLSPKIYNHARYVLLSRLDESDYELQTYEYESHAREEISLVKLENMVLTEMKQNSNILAILVIVDQRVWFYRRVERGVARKTNCGIDPEAKYDSHLLSMIEDLN